MWLSKRHEVQAWWEGRTVDQILDVNFSSLEIREVAVQASAGVGNRDARKETRETGRGLLRVDVEKWSCGLSCMAAVAGRQGEVMPRIGIVDAAATRRAIPEHAEWRRRVSSKERNSRRQQEGHIVGSRYDCSLVLVDEIGEC